MVRGRGKGCAVGFPNHPSDVENERLPQRWALERNRVKSTGHATAIARPNACQEECKNDLNPRSTLSWWRRSDDVRWDREPAAMLSSSIPSPRPSRNEAKWRRWLTNWIGRNMPFPNTVTIDGWRLEKKLGPRPAPVSARSTFHSPTAPATLSISADWSRLRPFPRRSIPRIDRRVFTSHPDNGHDIDCS